MTWVQSNNSKDSNSHRLQKFVAEHATDIVAAHIAQNIISKQLVNTPLANSLYRKAYASGRAGHSSLATIPGFVLGGLSSISPEIGLLADKANALGKYHRTPGAKTLTDLGHYALNTIAPKTKNTHISKMLTALKPPVSPENAVEAQKLRSLPHNSSRAVGEVLGNIGLLKAKFPDVVAYNALKKGVSSDFVNSLPGAKQISSFLVKHSVLNPINQGLLSKTKMNPVRYAYNHFIKNPVVGDAIDIAHQIGEASPRLGRFISKTFL